MTVLYTPFPPAHEGTLLEAILRWSSRAVRGGDSPRVETRSRMGKPIWRRGARGRGSHPRTREALGARPRPLRGAAFNGWTWLRRREAKALRMRPSRKARSVSARKNGSRDRNRRKWSAGWRACRSQGARSPSKADSQETSAVRRSIPSHSRGALHAEGDQTRACPGPTKEHGR